MTPLNSRCSRCSVSGVKWHGGTGGLQLAKANSVGPEDAEINRLSFLQCPGATRGIPPPRSANQSFLEVPSRRSWSLQLRVLGFSFLLLPEQELGLQKEKKNVLTYLFRTVSLPVRSRCCRWKRGRKKDGGEKAEKEEDFNFIFKFTNSTER